MKGEIARVQGVLQSFRRGWWSVDTNAREEWGGLCDAFFPDWIIGRGMYVGDGGWQMEILDGGACYQG